MANISLDIRANTQKALGEFKKLSRELDNKFIVQGLKLDVVKSAFRDITKEFNNAVGDQGIRTAESSAQLRRSLALNLGTFKRFSSEVSIEISKSIESSLRQLEAQGIITGDTLKESLNIASFLDFEGDPNSRKQALLSATNDIAKFIQDSEDLFGESGAGQIRSVLTGEATIDSLFGLDFESGGAAANRLKSLLLQYREGVENIDPTVRTQAILTVLKEAEKDPVFQEQLKITAPIKVLFRELRGLFSPEGVFGSLRIIGDEIKNFSGETVPRNLLQVTAKLLNSIFDRERGLFAVLYNSLNQVFGLGDPLELILTGAEFLTSLVQKLTGFFGSDEFKNLLGVLDPAVNAIKSVLSGDGFDVSDLNELISGVFESIRNIIKKITDYISEADAGQVGNIIGNIATEVGKTIPPLINLIFTSIGKLAEAALSGFANASGGGKAAIVGGLIVVFRNQITELIGTIFKQFSGGRGIVESIQRAIGIGAPGRQKREENQRQARLQVPGGSVGGTGFNFQVINRMDTIIRLLGRQMGFDSPIASDLPDRPGGGDGGRENQGGRRRRPGTRRRFVRSRVGRFGRGIRNVLGDVGYVGRELVGGLIEDLPEMISGNDDYLEDYDRNIDAPPPEKGERIGRDGRTSRERAKDIRRRRGGRFGSMRRGVGGLARRVGRGGLIGGALTALTLGSILSGGKVEAAETEGMSPEEQTMYREERRKSAREEAGAAVVGAAGGALGGAVGSVFGPAGTVIGGILGEMAGSALASMPFMAPINEGIGKLAEDIGSWLGDAWKGITGLGGATINKLGDAWRGITGFFGEEGPIQKSWKATMEAKDKIGQTISDGWNEFTSNIKAIPGNIWNGIKGVFSGNNPTATNVTGRALGGAGAGWTMVGENGPEMVNLGTGSVVYPQTSWAGLGIGTGGGVSQKDVTNNVTININAPGAEFFANELSAMVLNRLDEIYEGQKLLRTPTNA